MPRFAITKLPCSRFHKGITRSNLGKPDLSRALLQHEAYVQALREAGLEVTVLAADDSYPDSCFVEDTAVVVDEIAVIVNPGAPTRKGEIDAMVPALETCRELAFIRAPGTLEGGDVLRVGRHFYIGLTHRTNAEGAKQLGNILAGFGYTYSTVAIKNVLHLKTGLNYIDHNSMLVNREFVSNPLFKNFNLIEVDDNEAYGANCLYINEKLIMPKGLKKLRSKLLLRQYEIVELEMSEFEKMDGGLTCLSLRF